MLEGKNRARAGSKNSAVGLLGSEQFGCKGTAFVNLVLTMILSAAGAAGCCHLQLKSKSNAPISNPLPAALRQTFAHAKQSPVPYRQTELKVRSKYSIWRIEIPAAPAPAQ